MGETLSCRSCRGTDSTEIRTQLSQLTGAPKYSPHLLSSPSVGLSSLEKDLECSVESPTGQRSLEGWEGSPSRLSPAPGPFKCPQAAPCSVLQQHELCPLAQPSQCSAHRVPSSHRHAHARTSVLYNGVVHGLSIPSVRIAGRADESWCSQATRTSARSAGTRAPATPSQQ